MIETIALVLLVMLSIVGFVAIFFTTFGTLIILCGILAYAVLTSFSIITLKAVIVSFILYLCGEVLEYACVIIGTKKFGASNKAIIGALIGGVLGATIGTLLFGLGVVLGTFLGIFLGAFVVEWYQKRDVVGSLKVGVASLAGRLSSIIGKVIIALIMISIVFITIVRA